MLVPSLLIPAMSLALVGLIQGAGISANFPNDDGRYPDASRDFTGQGVANIASGIFEGMPVGGSVSASSLNKAAGARTRYSLVIAGVVMAVIIVALGDLLDQVAMPALAGLLIVVGFRTISPADFGSVWRTGACKRSSSPTTFVLTMMIPIQYAVLIGVGLSVLLYVAGQSNKVTIRRRVPLRMGTWSRPSRPPMLPANEVVILQPYGSMFFAAAPMFEDSLPSADAPIAKFCRHPASART